RGGLEPRLQQLRDNTWSAGQLAGDHTQRELTESRCDGVQERSGTSSPHLHRHRHDFSRQESGAMMRSEFLHRRRRRSGFTIIELLVSMVVGLIVMTSVVRMLTIQG